MADPKPAPVFTTDESFETETWSPEIAEERARMVQGDAPESPPPGEPRKREMRDPDPARPMTPAQGGETAERMSAAPRAKDATKQEVTRNEVAAEDEKPRRGRRPKAEMENE